MLQRFILNFCAPVATFTYNLFPLQTGDSGAVKQLLDSTQLDPDSRTRYQSRSALHLACGYGQMSVVEELLLVRKFFIVPHKKNPN